MVSRIVRAVLAAAALMCGGAVARADEPVDFSRDIRPILSNSCFACHGRDAEHRKANLRLDERFGAIAAAKSGKKALTPGDPAQSELIRRITTTDAQDRMPPADSNKPAVTPAQVDLLRRWIAQGGEYAPHWGFVPPARGAAPSVKDETWVRNPIDRFILARLEAEGIKPSPEADKVTLLRRLYLDLVGLPPTIAEVDAFIADASPDAYEKVVEKLLASPHYGERWGRHWLDAARYADSDGFEKDKSRQVWFYRDYVINAFNRDMPYDRFIIEQIAGDQLPNATQEQIVATGFLRNAMLNEEGGVDPEQFRMDAMFDRMDAIGKGILGLTIQCAQCHTHKYDPLTQEEYYKLFAFINNDYEGQRVVYTPDEQMKVADLSRQMREIEAELQHRSPDWQSKMAAWEKESTANQPQWNVLSLENLNDNDQRYIPRPDGSLVAQGYAPTKLTASFAAKTKADGVSAIRLELLPDPNLPCGGPGRSFKGTSALTDFWVEVSTPDAPDKKTRVKIAEATADYNQPEAALEPNFDDKSKDHRVTGPIAFAIDDKNETAWGIDAGPGRRNQARQAVFRFAEPIRNPEGKEIVLTINLKQSHGGWNSDDHMNNNLGRFRLSATTAADAKADPVPPRVRQAMAIAPADRSPGQVQSIFSYWLTTQADWKDANDKIDGLWRQWPAGSTTLTLIARDDARDTRMLDRGNWLKPTKAVAAGTPAFLHALPADSPPTRLTLARWLADRRSPTTARVMVNRIWQSYFGVGLVGTPEDFGLQAESPSHPQLLDWLACEFMDGGWSMKHMHRLIVTSAAYRQSSVIAPDIYARDPYNRQLARGPRFRVEGEIVRDVALAASGLLNDKIGGPSVMPPAPAFLFLPPTSYAPFPWVSETGVERYRRAIYTFRRRSTPYPALQAFDVPNADSSCVRRLRSNSPLQALVTLNEPIFVDCARALARKTLADGGQSDADRVAYAFRTVLARQPTAQECAELLDLLQKQKKRLAEGWLSSAQIATGAADVPRDLPAGANPSQLAAYTVVSRVLLNLDESITKE